MESKNVTKLLPSPNKISAEEDLLLMYEQRQWFLEMESIPGEDAVEM